MDHHKPRRSRLAGCGLYSLGKAQHVDRPVHTRLRRLDRIALVVNWGRGAAVLLFLVQSQQWPTSGPQARRNVGESKDTLKRQRAAITKFASKNRYRVIDEFYDAAVSGADAIEDRPGFAALLDRIESNGVRTVLVEDVSRFARQIGCPFHSEALGNEGRFESKWRTWIKGSFSFPASPFRWQSVVLQVSSHEPSLLCCLDASRQRSFL